MKLWCFLSIAVVTSGAVGCGSAPIHGNYISDEKNVWVSVEEPGSMGLSYCMSNSDGGRAEPVCYPARKFVPDTTRAPSSK